MRDDGTGPAITPRWLRLASLAVILACTWAVAGALARQATAEDRVPTRLLAEVPQRRPGDVWKRFGETASRRFRPALLPVRPGPMISPDFAAWSSQELAFTNSSAEEDLGQRHQSTAVLADGSFAVVWDAVVGSSGRDVSMQWVGAQGQFVFPAGGKMVAETGADENDSVIAANDAGGAFVAFGDAPTIRVQSFDASGTARWAGTGVEAALLTEYEVAMEPHLLSDSSGGVLVCFRVTSETYDILCQHLDANGTRLWGNRGVSLLGSAARDEWRPLPTLVPDGAGGIIAVWRNLRDAGASRLLPILVEGQRLSAVGAPLWGARPLVLRTTNLVAINQSGPDELHAVSDGEGGVVLAFNDWVNSPGEDAAFDVMAQRVSAAGELLWGTGAIVTNAHGSQQHEDTVAGPDGGAFIFLCENLSESRSRLRAFRLGPTGAHLWASSGQLLSEAEPLALNYAARGSFDGGVLRVAWTHQQAPGSFAFDVLFSALTASGASLASQLPLTTAPDAQFHRELAYSPLQGRALSVWDDRRRGSWAAMDVYGALVSDTPAPPAITGFNPSHGPVGTPVAISGARLQDASAVRFAGTASAFTAHSSTSITASVPAGARSGRIAVTTAAGTATSAWSFTVCTASIDPVEALYPWGGGSGTVTVTIPAPCEWTAVSSGPWIQVTGGSGTGSGSFSFSVAANSAAGRSGTITVGDRVLTISQAAAPALCGPEQSLVPDGRITSLSLPAGATRWLALWRRLGHSYSFEAQDATGGTVPQVVVFRGDDGCSGTSTADVRDTSAITPASGSGVRLAFTGSGSDPTYRVRVTNASGAPVSYRVSLAETAAFSPAWSTNGSYDTYYSLQNTTDAEVTARLQLRRTDGTTAVETSILVPPGSTASTNPASLSVPRNATGTARLMHDGPPGALLVQAAIANFGTTPAYVQPVRFEAVREQR